MPAHFLIGVGTLLGSVAYSLDRPHRRIVRRNLRFAYPLAPAEYIRSTARGVFKNAAVTVLEIVRMTGWSPRDLRSQVKIEGLSHMFQALAAGRGAVVISAHIGNWEVALACAGAVLSVPVTAVVKRMRYGPLDRRLNRLRSRFGTRIRYKQQALNEMMAALRRKEVLAVLIDQSKRSEGVPATFFGGQVITTSVVALLARRYRCPVLPVFCVRAPDGRLTVRVEPPLDLVRTGRMRDDLQSNAQLMTDAVERAVRRYPRQWLWFHKRWKKAYPDLYPEYFQRRARRKERERAGRTAAHSRIG